ncbi:MAG: Fic family protein [Candidatus Obscuribacterales bacterium]|nr:Fic family protein [Candidatus Obscuribacterales bacterium]
MAFDRQIPYNDLPDLPPAHDLETIPILKKCISAASALAELKGVGEQIPNQELLIRTLGLQEARVSSEIENIVTTTDDLYRALADSVNKADPSAKEVLRYQDALAIGFKAIEQSPILSTNLFTQIVSAIKQQDMQVRKLTGTKIVNSQAEIVYTPPEGESVIRNKLANLERFIHADDAIHPLVKLGVIHYQFEAIHPFTDGNGRTGRIINILYLVQQNLLSVPVLYLSRYLIEHKSAYYAGLRSITEEQQWEPWVLFILDAVETTARATMEKILAIKRLMLEIGEEVHRKLPNVYSKDLIELLFFQAYVKNRFLEEANIAKRQTASTYLKSLEEIGVLTSVKLGRENYYINRRLLNLLAQ